MSQFLTLLVLLMMSLFGVVWVWSVVALHADVVRSSFVSPGTRRVRTYPMRPRAP